MGILIRYKIIVLVVVVACVNRAIAAQGGRLKKFVFSLSHDGEATSEPRPRLADIPGWTEPLARRRTFVP